MFGCYKNVSPLLVAPPQGVRVEAGGVDPHVSVDAADGASCLLTLGVHGQQGVARADTGRPTAADAVLRTRVTVC